MTMKWKRLILLLNFSPTSSAVIIIIEEKLFDTYIAYIFIWFI